MFLTPSLALIVSCSSLTSQEPAQPLAAAHEWRLADAPHAWQFPGDHGPHPGYSIEWWYYTGHLYADSDDVPDYGYQFTFFRVGLDPSSGDGRSAFRADDAVMGHAAITDFSTGQHHFSEVFYRACPLLGGFQGASEPRIAWSRAPAGTDAEWDLSFADGAFAFSMKDDAAGVAFDLTARTTLPPLLHGEAGLSSKNAAGTAASHYYSFTRLDTRGRVVLGGRAVDVQGWSWMDHEFSSSQLDDRQVGWDWWSIQLDDGRDLMIYRLRDAGGQTDFARGTLRTPDGSITELGADDLSVAATSWWRSPATDVEYPSAWTLEIPGAALTLQVSARVPNQENVSGLMENLRYYEGSVTVRGAGLSGRGYVELTGYGQDARLPL